MKIHLVDGTYELFRAYFGAPKATAPDGREVGAVRGLVRSLLSLLRQDDVTHVACAFDSVIVSFRNELFPGYKTGEGVPGELLGQFELAEQAIAALGLVVWPMIEFEADDAIATAASRWSERPEVGQIVICSPDKDLAQMVREERVVCLDRRRAKVLDSLGVEVKFGVPPESIPDYLALVGDSADGFPGVLSWGARSAAAVLGRYLHIEDIPDSASLWDVRVRGADRLAANLATRRSEAALYKRLATLRLDVPLAEDVDALEWHGAHEGLFRRLCADLGFGALADEPHRWAHDPAPGRAQS